MSKLLLIACLLLALTASSAPAATTGCPKYDPQVVASVFAQYRNADPQVLAAVIYARFGVDPQLLAACYGITIV